MVLQSPPPPTLLPFHSQRAFSPASRVLTPSSKYRGVLSTLSPPPSGALYTLHPLRLPTPSPVLHSFLPSVPSSLYLLPWCYPVPSPHPPPDPSHYGPRLRRRESCMLVTGAGPALRPRAQGLVGAAPAAAAAAAIPSRHPDVDGPRAEVGDRTPAGSARREGGAVGGLCFEWTRARAPADGPGSSAAAGSRAWAPAGDGPRRLGGGPTTGRVRRPRARPRARARIRRGHGDGHGCGATRGAPALLVLRVLRRARPGGPLPHAPPPRTPRPGPWGDVGRGRERHALRWAPARAAARPPRTVTRGSASRAGRAPTRVRRCPHVSK